MAEPAEPKRPKQPCRAVPCRAVPCVALAARAHQSPPRRRLVTTSSTVAGLAERRAGRARAADGPTASLCRRIGDSEAISLFHVRVCDAMKLTPSIPSTGVKGQLRWKQTAPAVYASAGGRFQQMTTLADDARRRCQHDGSSPSHSRVIAYRLLLLAGIGQTVSVVDAFDRCFVN